MEELKRFLQRVKEMSESESWSESEAQSLIMDGAGLIDELGTYDILTDETDQRLIWLGCLEAAGVDNWEGIDVAQDMMEDAP